MPLYRQKSISEITIGGITRIEPVYILISSIRLLMKGQK
jgi:hypothetical protein